MDVCISELSQSIVSVNTKLHTLVRRGIVAKMVCQRKTLLESNTILYVTTPKYMTSCEYDVYRINYKRTMPKRFTSEIPFSGNLFDNQPAAYQDRNIRLYNEHLFADYKINVFQAEMDDLMNTQTNTPTENQTTVIEPVTTPIIVTEETVEQKPTEEAPKQATEVLTIQLSPESANKLLFLQSQLESQLGFTPSITQCLENLFHRYIPGNSFNTNQFPTGIRSFK